MRAHRLFLLVAFVGLLGLWTVWEQVRTVRTGYRCDWARRRIEELRNEKAQLEFQVSRLRTPEALLAKRAAFQICVAEPAAGSLVTARELAAIVNAQKVEQLAARRRGGSTTVRDGSRRQQTASLDQPRR